MTKQTNARQWEEVLAGVVSTKQDWEEDVLRVTRSLAGRRMPQNAISNNFIPQRCGVR